MGNFKNLRIMYGKTQAETARALGVSEDTVARREAADEKLSLRDVRILAGFFGCDPAAFLSNPPQPPEAAPGKKRKPRAVKRDKRRTA